MALSTRTKNILKVALADKKAALEVTAVLDNQVENVAEIATPASATAEDVADKVNELIQALVAAGLMA